MWCWLPRRILPEDDVAVEWLLLTSLPIATLDDVRTNIQYYCTRWMIEIFNRVLKSGCRVEKRRFEEVDRLLPCLGGLPDRGLADVVPDATRPQLLGHRLRGGF